MFIDGGYLSSQSGGGEYHSWELAIKFYGDGCRFNWQRAWINARNEFVYKIDIELESMRSEDLMAYAKLLRWVSRFTHPRGRGNEIDMCYNLLLFHALRKFGY